MNPKYPVYVISKGRPKTCLTVRELIKLKVPFLLVVEPQEQKQYKKYWPNVNYLITPFSNLQQGSIPVRNFVWQHSIEAGHDKHWILDDNLEGFHRLNNNMKPKVTDGTIFKCCEDFTDRYKNVMISGMNYYNFCKKTDKVPPYYLNTRIYSCILINNSLQFRWRGKFNEDTDLSLRVLKSGYCTILFNAFLCGKVTTQRMKGGNTNSLYEKTDNRLEFAQSLKDQHPDLVDVVWKFNRWHHKVNYKPFKINRLKRVDDYIERVGNQEINIVVRQAQEMLKIRNIKVGTKKPFTYKEELIGCPNKCMYCQYTYVRKHEGRSDFVLDTNNNPISVELEWMDINLYPEKIPRVTTAIDGVSQRVRYAYQRRLSDDQVQEFIIELSKRTKCNGVVLTLYNIIGMGETAEEWAYFIELIRSVCDKLQKKITILFHNTPFRPSPGSPSAYQPVNLFFNKLMSGLTTTSSKGNMAQFFHHEKLYFGFRSRMESRLGLVADLSVIRAQDSTMPIFNLIAYNSKFYNQSKPRQFQYILDKYDLSPLVREYSVEEKIPAWFFESYIKRDVMKKLTTKLKDRLTLENVR